MAEGGEEMNKLMVRNHNLLNLEIGSQIFEERYDKTVNKVSLLYINAFLLIELLFECQRRF